MSERRIASHPDQPDDPLANRLMLALGMWPNYVAQLGVEEVGEAAVTLRTAAHLYPMACEDYGAKCDEVERYRDALKQISDPADSGVGWQFVANLRRNIAIEALGWDDET